MTYNHYSHVKRFITQKQPQKLQLKTRMFFEHNGHRDSFIMKTLPQQSRVQISNLKNNEMRSRNKKYLIFARTKFAV